MTWRYFALVRQPQGVDAEYDAPSTRTDGDGDGDGDPLTVPPFVALPVVEPEPGAAAGEPLAHAVASTATRASRRREGTRPTLRGRQERPRTTTRCSTSFAASKVSGAMSVIQSKTSYAGRPAAASSTAASRIRPGA